jgi:CBS domain-containing protein
MNVADVMVHDVISVAPETPVAKIAELLLRRGISAALVIDARGRLVGIVSEGDLIRRREIGTARETSWWLRAFSRAETVADLYVRSRGLTAEDVMTRDLVTVTENTPLAEAAERMESFLVKRLPVMRDDSVVGVVSRTDLVRAVAAAGSLPAGHQDDGAIRRDLERTLEKESWFGEQKVGITVHDHVVYLWGQVSSPVQLRALELLSRGVTGVMDVKCHVTLRRLEPDSESSLP